MGALHLRRRPACGARWGVGRGREAGRKAQSAVSGGCCALVPWRANGTKSKKGRASWPLEKGGEGLGFCEAAPGPGLPTQAAVGLVPAELTLAADISLGFEPGDWERSEGLTLGPSGRPAPRPGGKPRGVTSLASSPSLCARVINSHIPCPGSGV